MIFDPQNMGLDTLFVQLCVILAGEVMVMHTVSKVMVCVLLQFQVGCIHDCLGPACAGVMAPGSYVWNELRSPTYNRTFTSWPSKDDFFHLSVVSPGYTLGGGVLFMNKIPTLLPYIYLIVINCFHSSVISLGSGGKSQNVGTSQKIGMPS
jgi:hypothetical protein